MFNATAGPALIMAAHPDDEVLGCGATMARLALENREVHVVFAATGIAGRYENPEQHAGEISQKVAELKNHAARACNILGVCSHTFLDYPDNRLDTVALMDLAHALKKAVLNVKPSVVFTHHFGDYNWDHGRVSEAALMACRANPGEFYPKDLYAYEVLSSTERAPAEPNRVFAPNVFVEVSAFMKTKLEALECYVSEKCEYPHPRSNKAVMQLAGVRGSQAGIHAAEAFRLIRSIQA